MFYILNLFFLETWTIPNCVSLEQGNAMHSSILAWEISQTEEPGRLQSIVLQWVKHELETTQQQEQRDFRFKFLKSLFLGFLTCKLETDSCSL